MALLLVVPGSADSTLTAALTGAAEAPGPGDNGGSGVALVDITTSSAEICVTLQWTIADGTASAAHIHEAPAGTAGPVVLPLFLTDDADGTFQGCFTDAVLAADIEAAPADYYVNIHSANFPAGAVRGQLGVQAVATAASYINPDTGAATENPNVDPNSECETPDQDDTQAVSSAAGTENNVHNDACLFDGLGLDVDAQVSFQSSGVGVINACPDPDGAGPKTATLSGDGLTCTLSGYQETGMAGDFEYHARVNSEVAGTQTVVFCADPEGNGCDDATISDTITVGWIEPGMVMVMKHLCDPSIQSEADFQAVEARAATNPTTPMGVPTLGSTTETVLACPVIVQPGDLQTPGAIGSGSMAFDFTTMDSLGTTQTLTTDTTFSGDNGFGTPVEDFACEDTVGYDADRDGTIEDDVCLDFSSYGFANVGEGDVTVNETVAPPGARFGTVRLSPPEISDDAAIGLSFTSDGTITFDSSADGDDMVTLHVYNFQATSPTPTPVASELPDAAIAPSDESGPTAGLAAVLAMLALGGLSFVAYGAVAARRAR